MAWTSRPEQCDDEQFASLRMDGTVQLWERTITEKRTFGAYRQVKELGNVFGSADDDNTVLTPARRPLALSSFCSDRGRRLCACNASGRVAILNPESRESVVKQFSTFDVNNTKQLSTPPPPQDPIVSAMGMDERNNRIALGGKDRDTVLFDLETTKSIWKAKNLPPDPQTLLQPLVWPTAILFLNADTDASIGSNVMAVGSAHKQIRFYDLRTADDSVQQQQQQQRRRPISYTPNGILEHRVTAMCQTDHYNLVVGDAAGYLYSIDMRTLGRQSTRKPLASSSSSSKTAISRYTVGPAGSIRALVQHKTLPRMAAVGLDRMLRVYDTTTRKQVSCMYLKQRLNTVLMGEEKNVWNNDDDDDEMEDGSSAEDDSDIDQDDVVQDYVDSDAEASSESTSEDEALVVDAQNEVNEDDDFGSSQQFVESDSDEDSSAGSGESDDDDDDEREDRDLPSRKKRKR